MNNAMDINKSLSSSSNMKELIKTGVDSQRSFTVEYDKTSIRQIPEDNEGRNTAIDVVIRSGPVEIKSTAFYKRPDISKVPNGAPWDDADVRPVFLYECSLQYLYNQDGLIEYLAPLVADRLNISYDSFTMDGLDLSRADEGLIRYNIVSLPQNETIINSTHCYAKVNIPEHTIWDVNGEYGLWAPESFTNDQRGRETFFKSSSVTGLSNLNSGNTDIGLTSSMIKSYIDKVYTNEFNDLYEIERRSQNTNGTSTSNVKIKNSDNYEFFGKYHIRQFDPLVHFKNHNNDSMEWSQDLQGQITSSASNNKIIFYANEIFARDEVTPTEAGIIQDNIIEQIFGKYGIPSDVATVDRDFVQRVAPDGQAVTEWRFTINDSISVKNDTYTVNILYARHTKCHMFDFVSYTDSNNHIGIIEGINDGWSTVNAEWWQIDSGGIRDQNGDTIRKPTDWSGETELVWKPPTDDSGGHNPGGTYYDNGTNFHNSTGGEPKPGNIGKPTEYDRITGDAEYKYTDLGSITDPNIKGFVI